MAHHKLGHDDEAKTWLDKAIEWTDKLLAEHEAGTTTVAWNRRLTLKLLREEAEGVNGIKRVEGFVGRGDAFLADLQQPERAVAEFTKAIELDPENGGLYQKRGDAYQAMGDLGKAEADYEEAKRLKEEKTPDVVQSVN